MITREQIIRWLKRLREVYEENREFLTQLDAAIGDADHGINMERGFKKVAAAEGAAGRESLDAPAFAARRQDHDQRARAGCPCAREWSGERQESGRNPPIGRPRRRARHESNHDPGPTSAYRMFEALGDTV